MAASDGAGLRVKVDGSEGVRTSLIQFPCSGLKGKRWHWEVVDSACHVANTGHRTKGVSHEGAHMPQWANKSKCGLRYALHVQGIYDLY